MAAPAPPLLSGQRLQPAEPQATWVLQSHRSCKALRLLHQPGCRHRPPVPPLLLPLLPSPGRPLPRCLPVQALQEQLLLLAHAAAAGGELGPLQGTRRVAVRVTARRI